MRSPVREVIPSSGMVWKWVVGGAPHAVDAENGGRRCEERLEGAFFRLGIRPYVEGHPGGIRGVFQWHLRPQKGIRVEGDPKTRGNL